MQRLAAHTRAIFLVFGIGLSLACLAVGAYVTDWGRTLNVLRGADLGAAAGATAFLVAAFGLFALRWRGLLATGARPPARRMFNFLMIGYAANAIFPGRPGDIIRAVLLRRAYRISLSAGAASIVLERLLDVLALCVLGVSVSFVTALPRLVLAALYSFAVAGLGVAVAVLLLSAWHISLRRAPERYPRLFGHRTARFIIEWLQRFLAAFTILYAPRRLLQSLLLTALGWGSVCVFLVILMRAFHLPVPPAAAVLVLVSTNLGAVIPSSPGALGVYHFMAVLALAVWGVDTSTAVAFAIGSHALTIGLHILLGLGCAGIEGVGISRLSRLAESDKPSDPLRAQGI